MEIRNHRNIYVYKNIFSNCNFSKLPDYIIGNKIKVVPHASDELKNLSDGWKSRNYFTQQKI